MMTPFDLRLWRRSCNWTQAQAARALGVSEITYKRYELADHVSPMLELATQAITTGQLVHSGSVKDPDVLKRMLQNLYGKK